MKDQITIAEFDAFQHTQQTEAVQPVLELDGFNMLDATNAPSCDSCYWRQKPADCLFCQWCEGFNCFVDINDDKACKKNEEMWNEMNNRD